MREFVGQVKDGKLPDAIRLALGARVRDLDGETVVVSIEKWFKKASDQQRRYWYGVIVPAFMNECGYSKDEAHDALLYHLMPELRQEYKRLDGSSGDRRVSWTTLDTAQATELCERAFRFAAQEFQLYIPSPGEYIREAG